MMAALPDDCIDLWITSPPYGEMRAYNGYIFDFEPIAQQLYRVTKLGGVGVWVVTDETKDGSESGESFRQALGFMAAGFSLHDTMIYEVAGTGAKGSNKAYWQGFEFMFVVSKGNPKTVNRIADHKNVKAGCVSGHENKTSQMGSRKERGIRVIPEYSARTNIWRYQAGNNGNDLTDHDAPFPEALARDHIISWSNPGNIILDPMIGSGTVGKMCKEMGRHFIGFDISQEYVDLAKHRVDGARVPLFTVDPPATAAQPEQAVMSL